MNNTDEQVLLINKILSYENLESIQVNKSTEIHEIHEIHEIQDIPVVIIKKKINHKRCSNCNIKTTLIDREMVCKCGLTYCSMHRFSNDHNCSYDYSYFDSEKLINNKIIINKVNYI
jgi:hypothetical protein